VIGIGTTTPFASTNLALAKSGGAALNIDRSGDGGAVATFSASSVNVGNISVTSVSTIYNTSSDRRVKENISPTVLGLNALMQIPVNDFNFINDPNGVRQQGFIAQELYNIYPNAVTTNGDDGIVELDTPNKNPWSVDYGRITPLIVKSIQELNLNLESIAGVSASSTPQAEAFVSGFWNNLFTHITTWLASAGNGVVNLFASIVHSDTVYTKTICVGNPGSETCITQTQLDTLLANAASASSSPPPSSEPSVSSTPADTIAPVIEIIGDNPATISVGSTYVDPGATVSDAGSPNIGYTTSVDGIVMAEVQIDTATSSVHTILYSATDQAGNTGTAERVVNVQ